MSHSWQSLADETRQRLLTVPDRTLVELLARDLALGLTRDGPERVLLALRSVPHTPVPARWTRDGAGRTRTTAHAGCGGSGTVDLAVELAVDVLRALDVDPAGVEVRRPWSPPPPIRPTVPAAGGQ